MDYVYYHLKTNSISEKWNTEEIEAYLSQCNLFPSEQKHNSFTSEKPFLSISLINPNYSRRCEIAVAILRTLKGSYKSNNSYLNLSN